MVEGVKPLNGKWNTLGIKNQEEIKEGFKGGKGRGGEGKEGKRKNKETG